MLKFETKLSKFDQDSDTSLVNCNDEINSDAYIFCAFSEIVCISFVMIFL